MALSNRILGGFLNRVNKNLIIDCEADAANNIKAQTVIINSTTETAYTLNNNISAYQIETGNTITDHSHPSPSILSITGILSSDDFNYTNPLYIFADTAKTAKETLEQFANKGVKLRIRYYEDVYESYIIQSASFTKNTEVGDNYQVSITFQKLVLATAATGVLQKGKQPIQKAPEKRASIFKKAGAGSLFK